MAKLTLEIEYQRLINHIFKYQAITNIFENYNLKSNFGF